MFVFDLVRRHHGAAHLHSLLVLEDVLNPRAGPGQEMFAHKLSSFGALKTLLLLPGVNHVGPVLAGVGWQFLPALDYEDTGIADLPDPGTVQLETTEAIVLVLTAVCKPRAANKVLIKT